MEDLFSDIDREKRDSIHPTDNYDQYYFGSEESDLEFYNRGECELDPCNYREGFEESWDAEHPDYDEEIFEEGHYDGWETDEEF